MLKFFYSFLCVFQLAVAHGAVCEKSSPQSYIDTWSSYSVNFGMEKIFLRFPSRPVTTQDNYIFMMSSSDRQASYKFLGYFPAIGNIDPNIFFRRELDFVSVPPYVFLGHSIYQVSNGDWVLDYTVHDTYCNLILKQRSVVTPFNAYTLRASLPMGYIDNFDFFVDSFRIQCGCN